MTFSRYVPQWTGFQGAPGFTTFHFEQQVTSSGATITAAAVRTFFEGVKTLLPTDILITYPGEFTIHSDDGTLTGAVPVDTIPLPTDCTGSGSYAAPVGARVSWETGQVTGGRRLRGRTFLVPLITSAYDPQGTILSTALTTIQSAASLFVTQTAATDNPLVVWSPTTQTGGEVSTARVPDQATVLRSRRD